jgi:xanthine/uracil/vitamin C permease (AzgA family)
MPMPVQPLKAVAALVIAQKIGGPVIYGAGLAIGLTMLFLTITGLIDWLARIIPKAVVRGIQLGLGLQLSSLALTSYVQHDGTPGYVLAALCFAVTMALLRNRRYPPALLILSLGIVYAFTFNIGANTFSSSFGIAFPRFHKPNIEDLFQGFLLLALPQIPLSLGNSLLATRQIAHDLFPEKSLSLRKIGYTYSLMNIFSPFLGGIPVCHGSGGMAGHYLFGARTGGSVVIYGGFYLLLGLFLSEGFSRVISVFPLPVLGVILLFEGLALMQLLKDTLDVPSHFFIALLVGVCSVGLPYGYLVGMVVGTIVARVGDKVRERRS